MEISVVVPCYNEEKNVGELHRRLKDVLVGRDYELIFVDDGSTDQTLKELEKIKDKRVRILRFLKNFGQTAAWDAGFSEAKGDIIITIDADLQNDPADIPKLLKKLDKGYDVVSGWRVNRQDTFFKKLFSNVSRLLRRIIINDPIHDSGCSLKAYRNYAVKDLDLHGEMHRYISEILALKGFKLGEVKVSHNKRKYGKTKYNLFRLPKGFLDLLVIAFWQRYSTRPIHLFGTLGILMGLFGFVIGLYLTYIKFALKESIGHRPLLLLAVLLIVIGVQFFIFGLLADIMIKMYYRGRKNYLIKK